MIDISKFKTFADRMQYVSSKFKDDCDFLTRVKLTEEEKDKFVFSIIDTYGTILKIEKEFPPAPEHEFAIDALGLQNARVEVLLETPKDKIKGIKALRALGYEFTKHGIGSDMGLKEAKDEIERVYDYQNHRWFVEVWECQGHLMGKNLRTGI